MSRNSSGGPRRWSLIGGSLLATVALTVGPLTAASASTHHKKKLTNAQKIKKGKKFYRGKTITFIAPDKPGGGFDQYARAYAPALATYLHATVNVLNIPPGNTVVGQNYVAHAKADGLTVGWLNAGPDIENQVLGLKGLTFNPERVSMLGGTAPSRAAVVSLKSPACNQWNSWKTVVEKSSSSNPVVTLIQTTGSTTFQLLMAYGVFGVHYRAIPGYASSRDLVSGFNRGDGCVILDPVSVLGPLVKGGKATPLLLTQALQKTNIYKSDFVGVPTVAQAEKQFKRYIKNRTQKVGRTVLNQAVTTPRGFFAQSKLAGYKVAALRAAFRWASYHKGLKRTLVNLGAPTGFESGYKVKKNYIAFLKGAKKVKPFLAAIGG